jgi:hypothetical protein
MPQRRGVLPTGRPTSSNLLDGDEFDEIHAVNALKAYLAQRQAWAVRLVSR